MALGIGKATEFEQFSVVFDTSQSASREASSIVGCMVVFEGFLMNSEIDVNLKCDQFCYESSDSLIRNRKKKESFI